PRLGYGGRCSPVVQKFFETQLSGSGHRRKFRTLHRNFGLSDEGSRPPLFFRGEPAHFRIVEANPVREQAGASPKCNRGQRSGRREYGARNPSLPAGIPRRRDDDGYWAMG